MNNYIFKKLNASLSKDFFSEQQDIKRSIDSRARESLKKKLYQTVSKLRNERYFNHFHNSITLVFLSQSELHIVRKVKKEEIETSIVSMFENRIESIDITHARISAGRVLDTRQGRARHTGRETRSRIPLWISCIRTIAILDKRYPDKLDPPAS